jgi:hypothetical protein
MAASSKKTRVYLEIGSKRTFAGAIEWPGWTRSGADEATALTALAAYGPRYARVLRAAHLTFAAPSDAAAFDVVERLAGSTTTDFGAPAAIPASDNAPVSEAELAHFTQLLHACWAAFDKTVAATGGKELRKGPRGGGRDLSGVIAHVLGADGGYLTALGGQAKIPRDPANPQAALDQLRQVMIETLTAAAHGEIAPRGPRGGQRWPPRYFVRRVAWHLLDHLWELEDRAE